MKFEIVSAKSDPYKPESSQARKRKRFKEGDNVKTTEGHIGTVISFEKGYYDRADKWVNRRLYRLDLPNVAGTPRVCFAGWELDLVK